MTAATLHIEQRDEAGALLVHTWPDKHTIQQISISTADLPDVERILDGRFDTDADIAGVFAHICRWRGRSVIDTMLRVA